MTDRKLARVVKIDALHPIEGADRIELAFIGGWQVVVQKGLYEVGDLTVYFEVDSMLPTDNPAFSDLTKLSSKLLFEVNGKGYARIRTVKLRKQLSQGYCVPLEQLGLTGFVFDDDLTKRLGVLKYEKPEEKSLNNTGGDVTQRVKTFPSFIPKTDQNRVQNIVPRYLQSVESGELFEKTYKLDGSSMTTWINKGELGVASRNVGFNPVSSKRTFVETLKHFIGQVWGGKKSFAKAKW
jgi:RNA ligase (TIGR02306 family)